MARTRKTLKDMIDAGDLTLGEELRCEPRKGETYVGTLQNDGSILYNGDHFPSPSAWAKEVAGNSRNGWRDVTARGHPLDYFRSQQPSLSSGRPSRGDTGITAEAFARMQDRSNFTLRESPLPPEEQQDLHQELLSRILELPSDKFEKLVGKFLEAKGFSRVQITGGSGDGGIDGHCEIQFMRLKVAFQAKRYGQDNTIGSAAIRNFKVGVVGRYDRGIFITTSNFTAGAKEEAEEPGLTTILLDGASLVREMMEMGLGVTRVPVVEVDLDEDFFAGLETRS